MSQPTRCQALTDKGKGPQCLRNAEPGSLYCWQHQGYIAGTAVTPKVVIRSPKVGTSLYEHKNVQDVKETTVTDPLFGQEYKPLKTSPKGSYLDMNEFKRLSAEYAPTILSDPTIADKTIVAKGPLNISLDIGVYESTLKHILSLPKGSYTYAQIIAEIRKVYIKKATHSDFFELIYLSDENEDDLARELYAELQDRRNTGEDIRLADFNGSNIYIEGIEYNTLLNEYYLILGS